MGKHLNNVVVGVGNFFGDLVSFRSNSKIVKDLKSENDKLKQKILLKIPISSSIFLQVLIDSSMRLYLLVYHET